MKPHGKVLSKPVPSPFKNKLIWIGFLFILPLSQLLEGTWSGYFMSGDWGPNKQHDYIRSGVWPAAPGGRQALAHHGFQSSAWTGSSKGCRWEMGCHCWGNGEQFSSGEGGHGSDVHSWPWALVQCFFLLPLQHAFIVPHITPTSSSSFNSFSMCFS